MEYSGIFDDDTDRIQLIWWGQMWRRWRCGEQQFTQFVATKLNSQIKKRVWERDSQTERGNWETVVLSIKFDSNLEREISWFRPRPCPKCTAGKAKAKQNVDKQKYEARRRQKARDDRKRNRFNGSRYRASHSGLSHVRLPAQWVVYFEFITFSKYFGKFFKYFPAVNICS